MERLTERTAAGVPNLAYPKSCYFQDGRKDPIGVSAFRQKAINCLAAYEDKRLTPEEVGKLKTELEDLRREVDGILADQKFVQMLKENGVDVDAGIRHMEKLIEAERDGRLVLLPCKVGDTLWYIFDGKPYKSRVHGISVSPSGELAIHFGGWPADVVWASNIGKTVFLTRQEAEEAVREGNNEK